MTVKDLEEEFKELAQRVAHLEGRLTPINSALRIAIITVLSGVLATYLGWLGIELVGQGKDIAKMQVLLSPQKLVQLSTDASDPRAIAQATDILSQKKFQTVPLDNHVVDTAGKNFILASEKNPSAWPVATMLVNYRSNLNATQEPNTSNFPPTPLRNPEYHFIYSDAGPTTGFAPPREEIVNTAFLGVAPLNDSARLESLSEPNPTGSGAQYILLDVKNENSVGLDNSWWKNVIVRNAHISYNGGPVRIENSYFVNCTFSLVRRPNTIDFATKMLSAASIDFRVSKPSVGD